MRAAAKIDANQPEIVAALRQIGCSVLSLAGVHGGCYDLLVARAGRTVLMEVKDENQPPSKRRLRQSQIDFQRNWNGEAYVVENVDQALAIWAGNND